MNKYFVALLFLLSGCAQLMKGQESDPPRRIDRSTLTYSVECNGVANTYSVCYEAASKQCGGKYELVEIVKSSSQIDRKIIFQCK